MGLILYLTHFAECRHNTICLVIDVLEIKDVADEPYLCLNILDLGTSLQQVVLLRQGTRFAVQPRVLK